MGWISNRRDAGSINGNPRNNGSDKGPLKLIVATYRIGKSIFDRSWVKFECGHEGNATIGARRGRCSQCKAAAKGK